VVVTEYWATNGFWVGVNATAGGSSEGVPPQPTEIIVRTPIENRAQHIPTRAIFIFNFVPVKRRSEVLQFDKSYSSGMIPLPIDMSRINESTFVIIHSVLGSLPH
jgi:hypothetical protein